MGNRIAYFEIGSRDFDTLTSFYRNLFAWNVKAVADGYAMIDTGAGSGITGGIGRSRDGTPWVSFYVAVEDPQATLDRARSLGGTTLLSVTEIPGLTFAMFKDPDGGAVGLVRSAVEGEPSSGGPSAGDGIAVDHA